MMDGVYLLHLYSEVSLTKANYALFFVAGE